MESRISGHTRLFALIGSPVGHSGSPAMYNYSFARTGVDAAYLAFDIPLEQVQAGVEALKTLHVGGFNVTMPDQTAVAGLADEISPAAKLIGACNTVTVSEDGKLAGIDMVEVHCAHGYLVSTFISQRTNNRTDEFGGCFENRMRLPRLIIENIRKKTGGMVGCEAAEFLAERGHQGAIIEMKDVIAADVTPESRRYMFEAFREHNVDLHPGAKVGEFFTDGVDYTLADGTAGSLRGFDSIVLAMGSRANAARKETAEAVCPQVLVIGEAAKAPGNAVTATTDALQAALAVSMIPLISQSKRELSGFPGQFLLFPAHLKCKANSPEAYDRVCLRAVFYLCVFISEAGTKASRVGRGCRMRPAADGCWSP